LGLAPPPVPRAVEFVITNRGLSTGFEIPIHSSATWSTHSTLVRSDESVEGGLDFPYSVGVRLCSAGFAFQALTPYRGVLLTCLFQLAAVTRAVFLLVLTSTLFVLLIFVLIVVLILTLFVLVSLIAFFPAPIVDVFEAHAVISTGGSGNLACVVRTGWETAQEA
jgi:hypothetical protein